MFLNDKRGISILGILFLGIVLILILSYFNISIRVIVESPTGQDNINYIEGTSKSLWTTYLKEPLTHIWNDIWIPFFWEPFLSNMKKLSKGEPTDFEINAPTVSY